METKSKIYRINREKEICGEYDSSRQAEKATGVVFQDVNKACKNFFPRDGESFRYGYFWVRLTNKDEELPEVFEIIDRYNLHHTEGWCTYCQEVIPFPKEKNYGSDHWGWQPVIPDQEGKNQGLTREDSFGNKVKGYFVCKHKRNKSEYARRRDKGLLTGRTRYPINQYSLSGELVKKWEDTLDVTKEHPLILSHTLRSICRTPYQSYQGFYWFNPIITPSPEPSRMRDTTTKNSPDWCEFCKKIVPFPLVGAEDPHWRFIPNSSYLPHKNTDGSGTRGTWKCKIKSRDSSRVFRSNVKYLLSSQRKDLYYLVKSEIKKAQKEIRDGLQSIPDESIRMFSISKPFTGGDITGLKLGNWDITENIIFYRGLEPMLLCKCRCGKTPQQEVRFIDLCSGSSSHCGCQTVKREEPVTVAGGHKGPGWANIGDYEWVFEFEGGLKRCRSSYEAIMAAYLNFKDIKFLYEPTTFDTPSGHKYTPDFYLIEERKYLELKGVDIEGANQVNTRMEIAEKIDLQVMFWEELKAYCGLTVKNPQVYKNRAFSSGLSWESYLVELFRRGEQ